MATFRKGPLFISPWIQCRHKSKMNVMKPRAEHYARRLFKEVTAPILLEGPVNWYDRCSVENKLKKEVKEERNLYAEFLVREFRKIFEQSGMVLIGQTFNVSNQDHHRIKNTLYKKGLTSVNYKHFNESVAQESLKNTKWANLSPLLEGKNIYIFSKEQMLAEAVKVTKKMPDVFILGGVVEDRILTMADIEYYAALPDLDTLRGQTLSILNSSVQKTYSLLNSHQSQLTRNLQQYIEQNSPKTDEVKQTDET